MEKTMRKNFIGLPAIMLCFLFLAAQVNAAESKEPSPQVKHQRLEAPQLKDMGGEEVVTDYFKVVIPKDWSVAVPLKKVANGGESIVFVSLNKQPAVSLSVIKTQMGAKEIGEQTVANMSKGGMKVGKLEETDSLWHASMLAPGRGEVWFGSKDGVASVTVISGSDVDKANELLSALDAKIKGLFPTKVGQ